MAQDFDVSLLWWLQVIVFWLAVAIIALKLVLRILFWAYTAWHDNFKRDYLKQVGTAQTKRPTPASQLPADCVLLPQNLWQVSIENGELMLSAWANGPDQNTQYWVKFTPSDPVKDHACLNDLKGVIGANIDFAA